MINELSRDRIDVYFVDDNPTSVGNFVNRTNDINWICRIASIPYDDLRKALRSKMDDDDALWCNYLRDTGLEEKELWGLAHLEDRIYSFISRIPENPIFSVLINTLAFTTNKESSYKDALKAIQESPSISFLVLDVVWEGYSINDELITANPIKRRLRSINERSCLGAYNLACEFFGKGDHRYLVRASSANTETLDEIINLEYKAADIERRYIKSRSNVAKVGAPAKIAEVLYHWAEIHSSSSVIRLRCKSNFFDHSQLNSNGWFCDDRQIVPHKFPTEKEAKEALCKAIENLVGIPIDQYNSFVHNGLKSFCLEGGTIGISTFYALLLLADAGRKKVTLPTNLPSRGYTPVDSISSYTKEVDYAEELYRFFKAIISDHQIKVSLEEYSIILESSQPIQSLFQTIQGHLDALARGSNRAINQDSSYIAKCIHYGNWILSSSDSYSSSSESPYVLLFRNNTILFLCLKK